MLTVAGDKYQFVLIELAEWFGNWYDWNMIEDMILPNNRLDIVSQLLYPSFSFGHVENFMALTKFLAYECQQQIVESNPTIHS